MSESRTWRNWILVPLGVLALAIAGTWMYVIVTRQPIHPDPRAIPSVTNKAPDPQWSGAVDRTRLVIRASLAEQNLPGLSVAVGIGNDIVWSEGFGWADIATHLRVTPDTRFRIGTASTTLTSAAAGILLDQGRLKLDEELQTYVPQFPKKQGAVTLRQLMAHTAGVGTDRGDQGPLLRQRCEQPVEALPHFANDPLLFAPGTQYKHSKYGWVLVSAAVEAAAKQPFLTFMGEQIFQRLGMKDTGAESAKQENPEKIGEPEEDPPFATFARQMIFEPLGIAGKRTKPPTDPATIYLPGFGYDAIVRNGVHVMRLHNLSCYAGSMAFLSTPSDMVRFGMAVNGGSLLQPSTVRLLQASQKLPSGSKDTGHGLGWDLDTATLAGDARPAAASDGELLGHKVMSLRIFREAGIVVAVMSNSSHADTSDFARKVADAFAEAAPR